MTDEIAKALEELSRIQRRNRERAVLSQKDRTEEKQAAIAAAAAFGREKAKASVMSPALRSYLYGGKDE